jgi:hypothetical protein
VVLNKDNNGFTIAALGFTSSLIASSRVSKKLIEG